MPTGSWPLSDGEAATLIDALAAAGDRRAAAEIFNAFDRRVADPKEKRLALAAYERALWTAPDRAASHLPDARTPLVGRNEELDAAARRLVSGRGLQLVGAGGIGKTRLALEAARMYAGAGRGSIAWISVQKDVKADELAASAAMQLCLPQNARTPEDLCSALGDAPVLIVLDTCENAPAETELFASCVLGQSAVKLLLTSRETIAGCGVEVLHVGPLSARSALPSEPAIRLFAERAIMTNSRFEMTAENASAVLDICTQLGGVPLAIEVACGYLAHVDVSELALRIREGIAGPATGIVHRTLSWRMNLLPQSEREVFLRVAVFDAAFSLEDARAVCEDESIENALERLCDAFLMTRDPSGLTLRYRLLDPVREFAVAQLSAERVRELRSRFVAYAAAMDDVAPEQVQTVAPSLLAALRFAASLREVTQDGLRAIARFGIPLGLAGYASPALHAGRELVAREDAAACTHFDGALESWSWLLSRCGQPAAAVQVNAERIARARQLRDARLLCAALSTSIVAARNVGDLDRAQAYAEEAIRLAREQGDGERLATALRGYASVLLNLGKIADAAELFQSLLALDEKVTGAREYTVALHDYATALRLLDRRDEAEQLLHRCISRALSASDYGSAIHAYATLARLFSDAGDVAAAHALLRKTLPLTRYDVNPFTRMYAFEELTSASFCQGRYEDLAAMLGYIDRTRERAQFKTAGEHAGYIAAVRRALRSHMDPGRYEAAYARGMDLTLDEAFDLLESFEPGKVTLEHAERFAPLSAREREIANLALEGRTNREIAQTLCVSVRTVDAHVASIFRKLGIERREQLAIR